MAQEHTMTLLCILIPEGSSQVTRSCGLGVTYKFFERSTVSLFDSVIDSHANIFGSSYEVDVLQNNRMKNNHQLGAPFPSSYAVNLRSKCQDESFTYPARRYVVVLGGET